MAQISLQKMYMGALILEDIEDSIVNHFFDTA